MSVHHPTAPAPSVKAAKPSKPYPDFPLFPHAAGVWAKKIRGQLHYFGPWSDPDGALAKYNAQKEALHAGRTPRPDPQALTVKSLVNAFLEHKKSRVRNGELTALTWGDYKTACDEIMATFGKHPRLLSDVGPDDFAKLRDRMAKKWGAHRLGKTIQFVRCVFKYGFESGMMAAPVRFGPGFERPSKKTIRLQRAKQGPKLFTADEVRALVNGALVVGTDGPELVQAGPQLRAMILLGINCGFGNADCGTLTTAAVDVDRGVIDFPRPKTGIQRRAVLWPETVAALKEAISQRPKPKKDDHAGLVFLTRCGDSWHTGTTDGPLSREFSKLLRRIHINGRTGLGFYTLRHTFRTIADAARDQPAADFIMGHESGHMSTLYREGISDDRLKAVAEYVRRWVFGIIEATGTAES